MNKTQERHKLWWDFNKKVIKDYPQLLTILDELLEIKVLKEDVDTRWKNSREQLLTNMLSHGVEKVIDIPAGFQATISKPSKRYSTTTFDLERFKKENPELYKKYCTTNSSISMGNTLRISKITKGCLEDYHQFTLEEH